MVPAFIHLVLGYGVAIVIHGAEPVLIVIHRFDHMVFAVPGIHYLCVSAWADGELIVLVKIGRGYDVCIFDLIDLPGIPLGGQNKQLILLIQKRFAHQGAFGGVSPLNAGIAGIDDGTVAFLIEVIHGYGFAVVLQIGIAVIPFRHTVGLFIRVII